jgi:hypothetical protein
MTIKRAIGVLLAVCAADWSGGETSVVGSEPVAPLSQRFAAEGNAEVPDFQKHIVPLLGRLGCNGRACHGSFQGRGGFQLSLFGYDFQADHEALLDEASGRVDVTDIDESLILAKPLDADLHEGGKRFQAGSWQHHVLRRWIESGAEYQAGQIQTLERLDVAPSEVHFSREGEELTLSVTAHWQDGTVEDVTELCRFSTNDQAIAEIDQTGRLQSAARGDTHVVVYYDNAVVPVPVIRPFAAVPARQTAATSEHPVDRLVQQKLDKLGIVPAGKCTDAEFIRRASLDITGILPAADAVRVFLADRSTDKRERLIEDLLDSPGYAAWWATRFSDWTGNSEEQLNNVLPVRSAASRLWYEWLRVRLDANVPYDEIIEGIVTASSREQDESYLEFCQNMTKACSPGNEQLFAERQGLPMYWARRNFQKPEDRAIGFAYAFLGVRIECAQCHKHPFDQWSKDDFEQFAELFTPVRFNQNSVAADAKQERDALLEDLTGGKKVAGGDLRRMLADAARDGKTVPFGELLVSVRELSDKERRARQQAKQKGRPLSPQKTASGKILGRPEPLMLNEDPRLELMRWLRSPQNPYFAKAIVNRVWSNYFGEGIVSPTDDMNLANPPVNAPLLDYLASGLIEHDFDLQWLHRTIVSSETYQRSTETNETNLADRTNFSRHIPRRLPAEVVYDAVALATGSDQYAGKLRGELEEMAIAEGKPRSRNQAGDFALEVFGQSRRESNCDCDRSDSPSLLQSIYLRNDADMHRRLTDKNGWVAQACAALGVAGPTGPATETRALDNDRKVKSIQAQFTARLRQFNKQPQPRQEKLRSRLDAEYAKTSQLLGELGCPMPSLDSLIRDPSGWEPPVSPAPRAGRASTVTIESLVEEAYLRTLSRYPEPEETEISVSFINDSSSPAAGVESLLWALVNTKEFIITH